VKLQSAFVCALGLLVLTPASAHAARECNGLDVCIPVAGPWVAVPTPSRGVRAPTVHYLMNCPRRSVVGGIDALVSDRGLDVTFLGAIGSPIGPGITTGRSVVFVATYAGVQRRATTFRPFVGCIPTSGGGRETTSVAAVVPGRPLLRRVRTLRVGPGGASSLVVRCGRGERLVGSSHAVAFRRRGQPAESWLGAVQVVRREQAGRVVVTARRSVLLSRVARVEVQVHALCARGRR
jgi:hypothetical protein